MNGKVFIGIIVFLVLFSAPLWINFTGDKAEGAPVLDKATEGTECILPAEEMKANHMDILNTWRDKVVREGQRYTELGGKEVEMSLSRTCLSCHSDYDNFCKKCHDYMQVNPYCWDCHVQPGQDKVNDKLPPMYKEDQIALQKKQCCDKYKKECCDSIHAACKDADHKQECCDSVAKKCEEDHGCKKDCGSTKTGCCPGHNNIKEGGNNE